jgi:hypothetical protein
MKTKILTVTVGLCFSLAVAQPSRAQGVSRISRSSRSSGSARALAPAPGEQSPTGQYSSVELEQTRAQLLDLADTVQQFAALAPPDLVDLDSLNTARAQIQQMPYQQLNTLRQGMSPSKIGSRLTRARQEIAAYSKTRVATKQSSLTPRQSGLQPFAFSDPTAFPTVSGFCTDSSGAVGPNRIPVAVILAADIIWFVADGVREFAQDACKEVVVIAGEGGNGSAACIPVDVIWVAAKAVDEGIHFCDDDLTGNVVDTSYAGLVDVHTDVNTVGTTLDNHISTANTDIDTRIANLDTHLSTVDTHIAAEFVALDTHIANGFTALDNHLSTVAANLTDLLNTLEAYGKQIMKLDLTPDGQRGIVPAILTCTNAATCPNVLAKCPATGCSWNNVGPLP